MSQRKPRDIAQAHMFPAPLTDQANAIRGEAVMFRYDGKSGPDGDSNIYVVIPVEDLAKIRPGVFDITEAEIDGQNAFFRETISGVSLYLEMDVYADRIDGIKKVVANRELPMIDCIGDLSLLGAPHNVSAPQEAAFEVNGFPTVSASAGLTLLRERASMVWGGQVMEADNDHPSLSP